MKKLMVACFFGAVCLPSNASVGYGDYKTTPCISVRQSADDTMKNWQDGYSFKDMLLKSSEFATNLSEKTSMQLKEAQLLTYRMATSAMEEPIHDSDFYKSLAVNKFASDYYVICETKYSDL